MTFAGAVELTASVQLDVTFQSPDPGTVHPITVNVWVFERSPSEDWTEWGPTVEEGTTNDCVNDPWESVVDDATFAPS